MRRAKKFSPPLQPPPAPKQRSRSCSLKSEMRAKAEEASAMKALLEQRHAPKLKILDKKAHVGEIDFALPFYDTPEHIRYEFQTHEIEFVNLNSGERLSEEETENLYQSRAFEIAGSKRAVYLYFPNPSSRYDGYVLMKSKKTAWESDDAENTGVIVEYDTMRVDGKCLAAEAKEIRTSPPSDMEHIFHSPAFQDHRVQMWQLPGEILSKIHRRPGFNLKVIIQTQETRNLKSNNMLMSVPILRPTKEDVSPSSKKLTFKPQGSLSDVKVMLKDCGCFNPADMREIALDRIVLMEYSEYFRNLLLNISVRKQQLSQSGNPAADSKTATGLQRIELSHISPTSFTFLVHYMYGSREFNLINLSLKQCIDLYRACEELKIIGLRRAILERIGFLTHAAGSQILDVIALCDQFRINSLSHWVILAYQKTRADLAQTDEWRSFSRVRPDLLNSLVRHIICDYNTKDPRRY